MFLVALISGCSGFEFVYNEDSPSTIKILEDSTQVLVSGDDASTIKSTLISTIGVSSTDNNYKLLVSSKKTSNNIVIKANQAVSQIEINHILNYSLQNIDENCILSSAEISSKFTYNLKSSGYSFGTDLAKKETINNNIEKNINEFFHLLTQNHSDLDCKNEN